MLSILRSSSGSTYCSLLKLYVQTINTLLYVSVMQQHNVCRCICCIPCREVGRLSRPTSLQGIKHIHMLCCCITETYNKVFISLTYNFSKEQYMLPENDLRIESTRVGTLIVATIYLQLIQNRYMFRSFTVLQCSH